MTLSYEEQSKQPVGIPAAKRGTVGPAPALTREIPRMIDELQSEINTLDDTVQSLCEHCIIIAENERPSDQPDNVKESIQTELGHQLFHIAARIRTTGLRIKDLNERIQL